MSAAFFHNIAVNPRLGRGSLGGENKNFLCSQSFHYLKEALLLAI